VSWFKVDDGFYSHEKVLTIPRALRAEAVGTWTLCGTWSADKDRDGYVPAHMIEELGASVEGAVALVDAKLWRRKRSGFVFINWSEFQPTREEKAERRLAEAARKAEYRARKSAESAGHDPNVSHDVPKSSGSEYSMSQSQDSKEPELPRNSADMSQWDTRGQNGSHTPPDPTRPDPTRPLISTSNEVDSAPPKTGASKGTRIPEPFIVTAKMRAEMTSECPALDIDHTTKQFVDYWRAASGRTATKKDWVAAWRFWVRRDAEKTTNQRPTPTQRAMQSAAAGRAVAGRVITSLESPREIAS
jgi:hypothetical protein